VGSSRLSVESAVLAALISSRANRLLMFDATPRENRQPNGKENKSSPSIPSHGLDRSFRYAKNPPQRSRGGVLSFEFNEQSGLHLPRLAESQNRQKLSAQRPLEKGPRPPTNSPEADRSSASPPLERPHHRHGHLKRRPSPKPSQK